MSLLNTPKISVTISRKPTGTVASQLDDYGSFKTAESSWTTVGANVKCTIQQFQYSYGSFQLKPEGQETENKYFAVFSPTQDVKAGDRINCTTFNPSVFYIISATPVVRLLNGDITHIECILGLNPT